MPQLISPWDVLTSSDRHPEREKHPECTTQVRVNAADVAERASNLLTALGYTKARVTSGFRTSEANHAANGAKNSAHMLGMAVDIEDKDGKIDAAISANPGLLDTYDLYCENAYYTIGWCHLSIKPTASGRRIFTP